MFIKVWDKVEKKSEKEKIKVCDKVIKKVVKEGELDIKCELYFFVLDFNGSIDVKEVVFLCEEVIVVLVVVCEGDEVLLCLEMGGGMVYGYGLVLL